MGAWIEIIRPWSIGFHFTSHPTMGAWIEILHHSRILRKLLVSHPTMGAWIEIDTDIRLEQMQCCRTPRWVRGLKFWAIIYLLLWVTSHPTMGAWIEILKYGISAVSLVKVAPHDGCVD